MDNNRRGRGRGRTTTARGGRRVTFAKNEEQPQTETTRTRRTRKQQPEPVKSYSSDEYSEEEENSETASENSETRSDSETASENEEPQNDNEQQQTENPQQEQQNDEQPQEIPADLIEKQPGEDEETANDNEEQTETTTAEELPPPAQQQPKQQKPKRINRKLRKEFDKRAPIVAKIYEIFKNSYNSAMKDIYVSDLISGENIEIKKDNILIDECEYIDEKMEDRLKFCSKNLYDYQKKAIHKLREIELNGYIYDRATSRKIITNAQELHLAIGAGKSIVAEYIALFYRAVPCHPIIISKSGENLPIDEPIQFKYYPYYYEQPFYYENEDNYIPTSAVVVRKNYIQRKPTIWLTHQHLMNQMKNYFNTDFPKITAATKIAYYFNLSERGIDFDAEIIITPATEENVNILARLSYEQPFKRVIIDDYTSMSSIDSFRQILASSTIFISGSGFERDTSLIPASYYTLKFAPVQKLMVVGRPEETFKGIVRDNIATMKLLGSSCEFSIYEFVQKLESICASLYKDSPSRLLPIILKEPYMKHFMTLYFVVTNRNRLKNAIYNIDRDYNFSGKNKNAKWANNKDEISYFLEWKKSLAENKANPLYNDLFNNASISSSEPTPIVQQQCMNCKADYIEHNGFGCICTACGSFFCSSCLRNCCTRKIIDSKNGTEFTDRENYYCSSCRKKNALFYINTTKLKDKSVFAYTLIDEFFDTTELKGHIKFDYYYFMFLHGLRPKFFDGKPVDIKYEIKEKYIPENWFNKSTAPTFQEIYSKDQLMIKSLQNIAQCLDSLNIQFQKIYPIILFYGTPKYIEPRIKNHFRDLCKKFPKSQINFVGLMFRDSLQNLIGLQKNVFAIIEWNKPRDKDEHNQLFGRLFRLTEVKLPFYIYIRADTITL